MKWTDILALILFTALAALLLLVFYTGALALNARAQARCPFRVKRFTFAMSALCPLSPDRDQIAEVSALWFRVLVV